MLDVGKLVDRAAVFVYSSPGDRAPRIARSTIPPRAPPPRPRPLRRAARPTPPPPRPPGGALPPRPRPPRPAVPSPPRPPAPRLLAARRLRARAPRPLRPGAPGARPRDEATRGSPRRRPSLRRGRALLEPRPPPRVGCHAGHRVGLDRPRADGDHPQPRCRRRLRPRSPPRSRRRRDRRRVAHAAPAPLPAPRPSALATRDGAREPHVGRPPAGLARGRGHRGGGAREHSRRRHAG